MRAKPENELLAAVFIGGTEKITEESDLNALDLPIIHQPEPLQGIQEAIQKFHPDLFVDLSDEPVVDYRQRLNFANFVLLSGASYLGADFRFDPIVFHSISQKPSISIVGTGKRVGKTAVSAYACRELKKMGFFPCVVAMGRGGPSEPEVLLGDQIEMSPGLLLKASQEGKHAASDHYEDALMSRVTTVGCRRCGGGLAGAPYISNVIEGARIANELDCQLIIFEGSGATFPPIKTDRRVIVVGADQPIEYIAGYFGPYRLRLSDLAVLTMCEEPMADEVRVREMEQVVRRVNPELKVVLTIFRPQPLSDINQKRVFFATTAPVSMKQTLSDYLEAKYGCKIVGISHNLSNRKLIRQELAGHREKYEVLLSELKASAVDVVTKIGLEEGREVVYADNIPITIGGDGELSTLLVDLGRQAVGRQEGEG